MPVKVMWYKVIPSNNGYYIKCTCDLPLFGFFDEDHKQWKQVRKLFHFYKVFVSETVWTSNKNIPNSLKEPNCAATQFDINSNW